MLKPKKKKSYPLLGEPEMADELNKYERSLPKGYRGSSVVPASKVKRPDTPLVSSDGIMGNITSRISDFFNKNK